MKYQSLKSIAGNKQHCLFNKECMFLWKPQEYRAEVSSILLVCFVLRLIFSSDLNKKQRLVCCIWLKNHNVLISLPAVYWSAHDFSDF